MIALIIILVILLLFHILYFILLPFVHGGEKTLRQIWVWWEDGSKGAWTENQEELTRDLIDGLFGDVNTGQTTCVSDRAREDALQLAEDNFEFERFMTLLFYYRRQQSPIDMTEDEVEKFQEVFNVCFDIPTNGGEVIPVPE